MIDVDIQKIKRDLFETDEILSVYIENNNLSCSEEELKEELTTEGFKQCPNCDLWVEEETIEEDGFCENCIDNLNFSDDEE